MSHDKSKGVWLGGKLDMNYYSVAMQGSIGTTNTGLRYWDRGKRTFYRDQDKNFMYSARIPVKPIYQMRTENDEDRYDDKGTKLFNKIEW